MAIQVVMIRLGFFFFFLMSVGAISLQLWQMYLVFYIDAFMQGQYTDTLTQAIMLVTP